MNFITLDFETATPSRDSVCEVGITIVENLQIKATKTWLVKPPQYPDFNSFNVLVHGIQPHHVADKRDFSYYWVEEIKSLIESNLVIAHYAQFDISVLKRSLDYFLIDHPSINFTCTYLLAKKMWQSLPGYDLKTLCKLHNIMPEYFNTQSLHRAGNDSVACAALVIKMLKEHEITSFDEVVTKFKVFPGVLAPSIYLPVRSRKEVLDRVVDPSMQNQDSIFHSKNLVFTGKLFSMDRDEAHFRVKEIGGIPQEGITKKTNFLIVGQQDYRVVGDDGMSSKQEKAIKYIAAGQDLEVLSEEQFLMELASSNDQ